MATTTINVNTAITNGVTPIVSGTAGRILFQGAGNVIQQDSNLVWDNTNKRLGIGATPATSTRLDVRAQGALSTDIAFRVRNSINDRNILAVSGNEVVEINSGQYANFKFTKDLNSAPNMIITTSGSMSCQLGVDYDYFTEYTGSLKLSKWGGSVRTNIKAVGVSYFLDSSIAIGGTSIGANGSKVFAQYNGTAPTTSVIDAFQMYSADLSAGNAVPHFRTENGSIINLSRETTAVTSATYNHVMGGNALHNTDTFDGYTVGQVVKALRNRGLLA